LRTTFFIKRHFKLSSNAPRIVRLGTANHC
jgi:hypothetical protein